MIVEFTPTLSEDEVKQNGLGTLLPTSLAEALKAFGDDKEWLETALGKDYVKWFQIIKSEELEALAKMDPDVRREMLMKVF